MRLMEKKKKSNQVPFGLILSSLNKRNGWIMEYYFMFFKLCLSVSVSLSLSQFVCLSVYIYVYIPLHTYIFIYTYIYIVSKVKSVNVVKGDPQVSLFDSYYTKV